MRILIVADTYPPHVNGTAFATHRMVLELKKRGNEVFVMAPSDSLFGSGKRIEDDGITVYRLRSILIQKAQNFRISPHLLNPTIMTKIIREVKPDIIHINIPGFLGQTAIDVAHKERVPVIGTTHFMPENLLHYLHLPRQVESILNTLAWGRYAQIYGRLDQVTSPTQTAADLMLKYKTVKHLEVISNGIDLKIFNTKNNGEHLVKKYKLPNVLRLLFVGRIDKEKNLDVLLRAIHLIQNDIKFHTVIVGKGKELGALKKLAKDLKLTSHVTFTGFLPDAELANIYKVGDIFVMPSVAELQSLVTMEAMATGLPVVGADAVALPHLIKDGRNGYLFKPGDHVELASKLLKLLQDKELREKMGKESLKIIQEHEMGHVIEKMEHTYEETIKRCKNKKYDDEGITERILSTINDVTKEVTQLPKTAPSYIKEKIKM